MLLLQLVLLPFIAHCQEALEDVKDDVIIDTLHKPAECPRVTKNGDFLEVVATSTVKQTGWVFGKDLTSRFQLGQGKVVPGWDIGLLGMCEGERRKLIVPPRLAYGAKGRARARIPGNAFIVYDIELKRFERKDEL